MYLTEHVPARGVRGLHTRPAYRAFGLLVAGWIRCLGRRVITAMAPAFGAVGTRHIVVFHRCSARARWSLDASERVVFTSALAALSAAWHENSPSPVRAVLEGAFILSRVVRSTESVEIAGASAAAPVRASPELVLGQPLTVVGLLDSVTRRGRRRAAVDEVGPDGHEGEDQPVGRGRLRVTPRSALTAGSSSARLSWAGGPGGRKRWPTGRERCNPRGEG